MQSTPLVYTSHVKHTTGLYKSFLSTPQVYMIQAVQSTAQLYRSTTQVYTSRDEYTLGLYKPCQTYQVYTRRTRYGLYIRRMFLIDQEYAQHGLYEPVDCLARLVYT